jgi:hypothetical protein
MTCKRRPVELAFVRVITRGASMARGPTRTHVARVLTEERNRTNANRGACMIVVPGLENTCRNNMTQESCDEAARRIGHGAVAYFYPGGNCPDL